MKQRLIIVGLGMATSRLLDELVKAKAQHRYDIVVFGDEKVGGYNRILLSHVLSGETRLGDIISHDDAWFEQHGIVCFSGRKVVSIDTQAKCLTDATAETHTYDTLVLATGSLPMRADVVGNQLAGVMSFRDVLDVQKLLALKANAGRVVVVGAGLLGLEAAYGLVKQGLPVTVVHRSDRIMSQQLDHAAGALLQAQLEALGIEFVLSAQLTSIQGSQRVQCVTLSNGDDLTSQAVVMAMGIRPNSALAQASGMVTQRGVIVDAQLSTSVDGIYALGECCEFEGQTYGLVAPIYRQISVLVNQLCGDGEMRFINEETPTQLKVSGVSLSSFGAPLGQADTQALVYEDKERHIYRKLMLSADGTITGAVLLGNTQGSSTIFKRYQQAIPLSVGERAAAVFGQLS